MGKGLVFLCIMLSVQIAVAADGSLDGSFGVGGIVTTDLGGLDEVWAAVVQPDKKLVALGKNGGKLALARYNINGSLDSSFGSGGIVITDIMSSPEVAYGGVVQIDGKLVAFGRASGDFTVVRYHADGSPDALFGSDGTGIVVTDIPGGSGGAYAGVLQPDGKLVAFGFNKVGSNDDIVVIRYNSDGSLDDSFGVGGIVITGIGGGNDRSYAGVLQPDGKLVALGNDSNDVTVVRYNSDGSLDDSFGVGGIVTTNVSGVGRFNAGVLQPDGKLVAFGYSGATTARCFLIIRYNPDGSLDDSFGSGGIVTTDLGGDDFLNAGGLYPDGKLVAFGNNEIGGTRNFAVMRYNSDGSLDDSFGSGGIVITDIGGSSMDDDRVNVGVVQSDGKLVAFGVSDDNFAAARYLVPSLKISPLAQSIRAKYLLLSKNNLYS